MFGQVPRKARSPSQRVPRKGLWGVQVLHQHTVQQDELEALEALCFLSAGGVSPHTSVAATGEEAQQQPSSSNRAAGKAAKRQQSQQQSKPRQQRQPKKQAGRNSPGSETSSGATQFQLQAAGFLPLEEIHPAALPSLELAQLLQQQQQRAESSDNTRLAASTLTPMPSGEEWAAQSRHHTPGTTQADPASPEPVQQQQLQPPAEPDAVVPSSQSPACVELPPPAAAASRPQQQQPLAVTSRPPVKGCFWHVYIARMIQADQQRLEREQGQQKQGQAAQHSAPSHKRRQRQQQQQKPAADAAASAKKRCIEQQQPAPASATAPAAAAAVQHILAHTLLQQRQQPGLAPVLLPQQAPGAAQLLQALSAAGGLPACQPPGITQLGALLGAGLAPAAGAAACPQLLQALAAAPFAAPGGMPGVAGAHVATGLRVPAGGSTAALGGSLLQGPQSAAAASRLFGPLPGSSSLPALAPAVAQQLQGLLGQLSAGMGAPAVPGAWPGVGPCMGYAGGMQVHPSRIAA